MELKEIDSLREQYPVSYKRWVAREIESSGISPKEAKIKYSIFEDHRTISFWVERYGLGKELSLAMLTPEEKLEKLSLEKRIKELEKALEYAKLKNIAIETMIDIAEENLKITIRKKAGPKQ
jgi:hypothetical protein